MDEVTGLAPTPEVTTTAHGVTTYLPLPREQRKGIALCLSGGGYRAALFHLGALRRLNELGILAQVNTITSVSGGSVFAAQLASHLADLSGPWPPQDNVIDGWEDGVAKPIRELARRNIRTLAVLSRYHPRNLINRSRPPEALATRYERFITESKISELPENPRFIFCATDMEFGCQWLFDTGMKRVGSTIAGYAHPSPEEWTVARAVAASAALPGVFEPVRITSDFSAYASGTYQQPDRSRRIKRMSLTDGGMYDNLGLEPVWRDHQIVLVSDGGPSFASWQTRSLFWRSIQHPAILLDQATDVRKRWLISNFLKNELSGTYWGIGSLPGNYEYSGKDPVYSDELIKEFIQRIRIDFDAFSNGEIAILENHGYVMAGIAIARHSSDLVRMSAPARVPHESWMKRNDAKNALRRSDRVSLLGRGGLQ